MPNQAGWHTASRLTQMPNVSLLLLPMASPELNRAEQVCQLLRDRRLANQCNESYEHIVDTCCEA
jgi:hypothetical protein